MVGENRRHRARSGQGTKERKDPWFARADLDGGGEQETQGQREKREKEPWLHALTLIMGEKGDCTP